MAVSITNIRDELLPTDCLTVAVYERYSFAYTDFRNIVSGFSSVDLASETRSIELLKDWLNPEQRAQFEQDGKFSVVGSKSKVKYWITDGGQSFNVVRVDPKRKYGSQRLCFVPENARAKGDVMLAQQIILETNENHAMKIANKYDVAVAE